MDNIFSVLNILMYLCINASKRKLNIQNSLFGIYVSNCVDVAIKYQVLACNIVLSYSRTRKGDGFRFIAAVQNQRRHVPSVDQIIQLSSCAQKHSVFRTELTVITENTVVTKLENFQHLFPISEFCFFIVCFFVHVQHAVDIQHISKNGDDILPIHHFSVIIRADIQRRAEYFIHNHSTRARSYKQFLRKILFCSGFNRNPRKLNPAPDFIDICIVKITQHVRL